MENPSVDLGEYRTYRFGNGPTRPFSEPCCHRLSSAAQEETQERRRKFVLFSIMWHCILLPLLTRIMSRLGLGRVACTTTSVADVLTLPQPQLSKEGLLGGRLFLRVGDTVPRRAVHCRVCVDQGRKHFHLGLVHCEEDALRFARDAAPCELAWPRLLVRLLFGRRLGMPRRAELGECKDPLQRRVCLRFVGELSKGGDEERSAREMAPPHPKVGRVVARGDGAALPVAREAGRVHAARLLDLEVDGSYILVAKRGDPYTTRHLYLSTSHLEVDPLAERDVGRAAPHEPSVAPHLEAAVVVEREEPIDGLAQAATPIHVWPAI